MTPADTSDLSPQRSKELEHMDDDADAAFCDSPSSQRDDESEDKELVLEDNGHVFKKAGEQPQDDLSDKNDEEEEEREVARAQQLLVDAFTAWAHWMQGRLERNVPPNKAEIRRFAELHIETQIALLSLGIYDVESHL